MKTHHLPINDESSFNRLSGPSEGDLKKDMEPFAAVRSPRPVGGGEKARAFKIIFAFLFGAAMFPFLFQLADSVRPVVILCLGAVSFLVCQYLLSRGNAQAAKTDWTMVLAMNALPVVLLVCALIGVGMPLEAGAQTLRAVAVVALGVCCSYAGAVVAARAALKR